MDEAGVFDAVRLGVRHRKDNALAEFLVRIERQINLVAIRFGDAELDPGTGGEAGRGINGQAAVGRDGAGAKRQR